jgi:microcystin-dependent protein
MSSLPIGTILIYSLTGAPTDYLLCNGTSYNRTTYSSLYSVIGTTYGSTSSTTFKVPNFTSKFPIGKTSSQSLGDRGGVSSASITSDNLPSHKHSISMKFYHTHTITYNQSISSRQYLAAGAYPINSQGDNEMESSFRYNSSTSGITSSTELTSDGKSMTIENQLQSTGESISLDVTNSQMNLNYIIKYQ